MCYYPIPYAHAKNIYDVDIGFYKKLGIKFIFLDLDNTLDSYKTKLPSSNAKKLIETYISNSITPIIISNNKGPRVSKYSKELGIEFLPNSGKPFSRKLKKFMKEKGIDPNEVIMVGDQLATDIKAAKGAGVKSLLVDKIVKEDQLTTKINRFFEKPVRMHYMKKGKFIDWRIIYGSM
jgi:HAD superfamily phosphatase (TIGR01668 family)